MPAGPVAVRATVTTPIAIRVQPACAMRPDRVAASILLTALVSLGAVAVAPDVSPPTPIVLTQLPVGTSAEGYGPRADGMLRAEWGEGARVVVLETDGTVRLLSEGFAAAADPDVSFDGSRIVFAGRRAAGDCWEIWEVGVDGSGLHQITDGFGDARGPIYLSSQYTIDSSEPWYLVAFMSTVAGELDEHVADGQAPSGATSLYTSRLDGSEVRRLTHNLSSDLDPFLMQSGRILYSSWQRSTLSRGPLGRIALFAINNDGADVALYAGMQARQVRHMATETTGGLALFVEADRVAWDGSGPLGAVSLRRPHHTNETVTGPGDGLFAWPSPLPDGSVLVSRREHEGGTHAVVRLDPESGDWQPLFDDPEWHDLQAKVVRARPEPDGRSSVVSEADPDGRLYGLDVYVNDLRDRDWLPRGEVARLRVLEGIPRRGADDGAANGAVPLLQKRILGDVRVEPDGSFYIKVPAATPIQLQLLDDNGLALRTCSWIWSMNHEPRGCIGCHEDPELTPENRFVDAVQRPPIELTLPPDRRRFVDFRRDVQLILDAKCAVAGCHVAVAVPPILTSAATGPDGGSTGPEHESFSAPYRNLLAGIDGTRADPRGRYVHPGKARTSPLVWSLLGGNTARPWDGDAVAVEPPAQMPPPGADPLTPTEIRTIIEWIDLGALFDGTSDAPGEPGGTR